MKDVKMFPLCAHEVNNRNEQIATSRKSKSRREEENQVMKGSRGWGQKMDGKEEE